MTTADLVQMLLAKIKAEPDALDPHAVVIDGEDVIGVEDPETGAQWFVEVKEA